MITVDLGTGSQIRIDRDDWRLLEHHWHEVNTGNRHGVTYAQTHLPDGSTEYLHRMVAGCAKGDGLLVDHVNFDGLDNRKSNLRITNAQGSVRHQRSKRTYADTDLPKYRGVFLTRSKIRPWNARIRIDHGRRISVGNYATPEEAALAYDAAAREYHGDMAHLNFPFATLD